jgi:hypothetical protein
MQITSSFFDYFIDTKRDFSNKAMLFVLLIFTLFLLDSWFNLSDNYHISNKLEQIGTINDLLEDSTLPELETVKLERLRTEILHSESTKTKLWKYMYTLNFSEYGVSSDNKKSARRSILWHALSATWFLWIVGIALIRIAIKNNSVSFVATLKGLVLSALFIAIISWILIKYLAYVPLLKYPIVNYLLNFLLSAIVLGMYGTKQKKNTELKAAELK